MKKINHGRSGFGRDFQGQMVYKAGEGCFFVECASMTCAGPLGQELTAAADRLSSLN